MKKILILLPFILLISCGVQKRRYQKGFYVNWHQSGREQQEKKQALVKNAVPVIEVPAAEARAANHIQDLALAGNNRLPAAVIKKEKQPVPYDEPCDLLIFKDGSEVSGKVTEVTPNEIKYKKCSMLDGPAYVAKKSDLFMIKYANGTREVFKDEPKAGAPQTNYPRSGYNGGQETNSLAVTSLVMGILSIIPYIFLVTGIIAIISGGKALRQIRAQPDRYKGEGIASAGRILGIVFLALYGLLLIIGLLVVLAFFI